MKLLSLFKKKNKKNRLKYKLQINQNNEQLSVKGMLNNNAYFVHELWIFSRETSTGYKVCKTKPSNDFQFTLSLDEVIEKVDLGTEETYDWYLRVAVPYSELSEAKKDRDDIKLIEKNGNMYAQFYMRFGRFQNTDISGLSFYYLNNNSLINYITTKGNLSLVVNGEPDSPTKIQIDKYKQLQKSEFKIEGKLFTRNSLINDGSLIFKGRESGEELSVHRVKFNHLSEEVSRRYGLNRYTYTAEAETSDLDKGGLLEEDIYDLFLKLDMHDKHEPKYVRVGRPTFRARFFLKDLYATGVDEAAVLNPYYTFKASNLSMEVYRYPIDTFQYLRRLMRWAWILRLLNKNKNVWIVGEKAYKAQDTGFAFFKYMRENHPQREVYYVIDKNSPEKERVEQFGNVLEYKSKEHIWHTIISKKVISSHHPDYLFPLKTPDFKRKVKADKVFLQHGVMGTKNMVANYGKNAPGFDTDFFLVSSDFEKEMIVNDFGYAPEDVFVTGLSRFDTLFANDVEMKRQLLIIPTWRDWIVTDEAFFASEYYQRYEALINNQKLHQLASSLDFEIILCLHPNMQRFTKHFENDSVRVINQGEVDVQSLIKQSALMLTDYSSVGFDFSFLHKPIIYYQFDRGRFIGKRPSHLDLNNDLPGEICFEQDEVVALIEEYAANDFNMKSEYKERANKFIKNRDQSSSERIYRVIKDNQAKRGVLDNPKAALLWTALFKRFRKSSYYFPSMKLFYKVGTKIIPVDKKLILFESGVGKQFGDSPKNIYEEIIDQNLGYKKVWVYNKNFRFNDENTKRIKRLSPQYYYYLIKAGYWVNNQNFPSYLVKRPETTYLQTWHGTPLKRMLYDIEDIHGRSDDYVERIGKAVENWDYLISPSSYATNAFRSAFRYKGVILEVGYPRNDIFYNEERHKLAGKVQNRLQLPEGKKVVLYAPTFRDDQSTKKNKFSFNVNMDLHKMKEQLGDEYIILLRMHVVISNKITIDESLKGFVKNVSAYPDMQELLLITDLLITDYSSVMFDFANTGKPILFYTYDLDHYRDNIRGFYMDFENEAPGPLLFNTEEIITSIENIDSITEKYQDKYEKFQEKFCKLDDGEASKRVVEKVFKGDTP